PRGHHKHSEYMIRWGRIPGLDETGREMVALMARCHRKDAGRAKEVINGAKVSDKIEVLDALLERVNAIVIGGAMANTFLEAQGKHVGKSKVERDKLAIARNFLRKASEKKVAVHLPTDVLVGTGLDDLQPSAVRVDQIGPEQMALDIGPGSIE